MPQFHQSPPDLSTIGGRLRWAREHYVAPDGAKLDSIRKAARHFGWNDSTYKSHEQGIRQSEQLKREHAEKYARAFGVTIEWLVYGRGEPYARRRA